jgi:hypothetical protein
MMLRLAEPLYISSVVALCKAFCTRKTASDEAKLLGTVFVLGNIITAEYYCSLIVLCVHM